MSFRKWYFCSIAVGRDETETSHGENTMANQLFKTAKTVQQVRKEDVAQKPEDVSKIALAFIRAFKARSAAK